MAAYTKSVHAWRELCQVEGVSKKQEASGEWRCRFPLSQLDAVAAILRPRKHRTLDPDRARAIGKATAYGAQSDKTG